MVMEFSHRSLERLQERVNERETVHPLASWPLDGPRADKIALPSASARRLHGPGRRPGRQRGSLRTSCSIRCSAPALAPARPRGSSASPLSRARRFVAMRRRKLSRRKDDDVCQIEMIPVLAVRKKKLASTNCRPFLPFIHLQKNLGSYDQS